MVASDGGDARAGDEIEHAALLRISPDAALLRRVAETVARLIARGQEVARVGHHPLVRCLVAGSATRGTFLKDRVDLDFFLLFPPSLDRAALEREGLAMGRAILESPEMRYAEHPYLRGQFEGFAVDAVPGYAVDDPSAPQSAVDRTPFHQTYLESRLTPATVEAVRLAKQFLRAHGLYGSEAKTAGFSGYLVELLVIRFGGFRPLLAAARQWRPPVRLESTPGAAPKVPDDVALILDDPVDPHRNVASALSRRNLATFILAAEVYLRQPSLEAFEVRPGPLLALSEARTLVSTRGTHVVAVGLPRPPVVDDILYPQLRKAERAIYNEAERQEFCPFATASAAGEGRVVILLELAHAREPAVRFRSGPPIGVGRADDFLAKWFELNPEVMQGPYMGEDGALRVESRRASREFEPALRAELPRLALGRDLLAALDKSVWVRSLTELEETPELTRALAGLLKKRLGIRWTAPA